MKIFFLMNLIIFCLSKRKNFANASKHNILEYGNACVGRIVGGFIADVGTIPFQVSIRKSRKSNMCGGSIIKPSLVLTAAHCLYLKSRPDLRKYQPENLWVVAGSYNQYREHPKTEQWLLVAWAYIHQNFINSKSDLTNDVCVLTTSGSFVYNKYVQPVRLEHSLRKHDYEICQVSGFGYTNYISKKISPELLYTCVNVIPNKECLGQYKKGKLCAGTAGKDACVGDSGGPLVCGQTQVGIVSYGYGCANIGIPGIYARVSTFADFIDGEYLNVTNNSICVVDFIFCKLFLSFLLIKLI